MITSITGRISKIDKKEVEDHQHRKYFVNFTFLFIISHSMVFKIGGGESILSRAVVDAVR